MKRIFQWKIFLALGVIFATTQCSSLKQMPTLTKESNPPVTATRFNETSTPAAPATPTSIFDGTLPKNMTFVDTQAGDWTIYDPVQTPELQQRDFNSITVAPDGKVWIGGKNGIAMFDGWNWTSFFLPTDLIPKDSAHLNNIIVDQNKMVWTGGYGHIYQFDRKSWSKESEQVSVRGMEINPKDGALWFALTDWGGAMKFDGKNWTTYTHEDGLIGDQVSDISIDKNGNIWFATGDGISSYDGNEWHNYSRELFCPESSCYLDDRFVSIAIDAKESVWVAYHEGGLFHYAFGKWERFENDLIFKDYFPVEHVCFTPDGKLWIGKWSQHSVALFYFEDNQWHIPRISDKKGFDRYAPVAHINGIACANDNSIWYVSASMGVGHYIP